MWPFFAKRKRKRRKPPAHRPAEHTIAQILAWADEQKKRTGRWPIATSGPIAGTLMENWRAIDHALRVGLRGLAGGSSLAQLLAEHRGVRNIQALPRYTIKQILAWADAFYRLYGRWPSCKDGIVPGTLTESWINIDQAIRKGLRGLNAGSSLPRLLAEHRGVRNLADLPPLSVRDILRWADAHYRRTGRWPHLNSGPIPEAPGETWGAVHSALSHGVRGLPGGSTLPQLLAEQRGVRNLGDLPLLTIKQILAWADNHYRRTGTWPRQYSGLVLASPGESWGSINLFLMDSGRGLSGGSSLAQLLAKHRGTRNKQRLPRYTIGQILFWVDAWRKRTGQWPKRGSGPIPEAPGETWMAVHIALRQGRRGLPGGSSLPRLLAERRGVPIHFDAPRLSVKQIRAWADRYREQSGRRPTAHSGAIPGVPGETWAKVDAALRFGCRGLPGGSSLGRLLGARQGDVSPRARS